MKNTPEHIIKLSKLKLSLMFVGSWTFVTAGVFFMIDPDRFVSIWMRSPEVIFTTGLAGTLFFGLVGVFLGWKLFDTRPGLILTDEGFYDNSSGVSAGFVKWSDIQELEIYQVARTKMIFPIVSNPQDYINRQSSKFKQRLMKMNFKSYGTPLTLTSNGLQCGFQELHDLIQNELEKNKAREHNNA